MSDVPPAADDEVERRLAALKAGADPGSPGGAVPPAGAGGTAEAGRAAGAGRAADAGPARVGEVLEDARGAGRSWRDDAPGGGTGAPPRGGSPGGPPPGPGAKAVAWGISQAAAGRLGLWIGVGLVDFGGYLVLAEFVPGIAFIGSAALVVVGAVLVGWNLTGRAGAWALYGGAVLAGFGAARLVADLAGLPSAGWGTLGAGLGLLAIAGLRAARRQGVGWQAWVGGFLAVWGGWGVLGGAIPGFPTLGDLIVPLILVLVGVVVLRRGMRPGPPGP